MTGFPTGQRIRDGRRERGLTQTALAGTVGISPSYLNLIEHDRRPIGGALLQRIARALDLDLDRLTGFEDARLAQDIAELARALALPGLDETGAQRFVARSPEWAAAFRTLHRRYSEAVETTRAMSDRLSQDPHLMELSHTVLTRLTSIRSFAGILQQYPDIDTDERARFLDIIAGESERLGASASAMIALLDSGPNAVRPAAPLNEVDDFIIYNDNHFPALEDAADRLRATLAAGDRPTAAALAGRLGMHDGEESPETGARLPTAAQRFRLARRLAEAEFADLLDAMVRDERLTSPEAAVLARRALAGYAAAALLFPYHAFLEAATVERYDIDRLCQRFDGSFEQVAHRLVTLRRPDAAGVPFAFLRADPAGNTSKPFSTPGLRVPRLGGACPLWAVYAAFAQPDRTIAQLAEMPQGERFLFVARRVTKGVAGFGAPITAFSVMLGCDIAHADSIVYGDAFAGTRRSLATPVGFSCRACPRDNCAQRAHPAIAAPAGGPSAAGDRPVRPGSGNNTEGGVVRPYGS